MASDTGSDGGEPRSDIRTQALRRCHTTLVDGDVLYLSRRDATYDLRSASRIGGRKPAYGTALGKATLGVRCLGMAVEITTAEPVMSALRF